MHRKVFLWLLAALHITSGTSTAVKPPSKLIWGECPDQADREAGLDCAQLVVPVDWNCPDGATVTIGMARLRGVGQGNKRVLFYNPGGPGLPSSSWIREFATGKIYLSDELKSHFDVIGIDSRGIGLSTPLRCDHTLWNQRPSQLVWNETDFHRLAAFQEAFAQSCALCSGPLARHVGTTDVAKDYEAVRIALGQDKVSLLLQSYGTQIGAAYASNFPAGVDRMVLDGNVDHSLNEIAALSSETYGLERVWTLFVDWCSKNTNCAAHGMDIDTQVKQLLDRATRQPILSVDCAVSGACKPFIRPEDIVGTIQSLLDYEELPPELAEENYTWQSLSEQLVEAFKGNLTDFSPPMALDDAGFSVTGFNGPWMQTPVINCLDWRTSSKNAVDLMNQYRFTSNAAPTLRGLAQQYAINSMCFAWPFPVEDPQAPARVMNISHPILLVNSLFDPETPFDQTLGLKEQIQNAVVLMTKRPGHTVYVQPGPAATLVDAYLNHGTIPEAGTVVEY